MALNRCASCLNACSTAQRVAHRTCFALTQCLSLSCASCPLAGIGLLSFLLFVRIPSARAAEGCLAGVAEVLRSAEGRREPCLQAATFLATFRSLAAVASSNVPHGARTRPALAAAAVAATVAIATRTDSAASTVLYCARERAHLNSAPSLLSELLVQLLVQIAS